MVEIIRLNDGTNISFVENEAPDIENVSDFCVHYVKTECADTIAELRKQGYIFADRLMKIEITLADWEPYYYREGGNSLLYKISGSWSEEDIYELVKDDFGEDRRFAVSIQHPDERRKRELLHRYIRKLKDSDYQISLCYKGSELVGFNLWKISDNVGSILLGASTKKFRNGGVIYLYELTLLTMKKMGALKLSNRVSTSNLAAVKLHAALGRNKKTMKITGFEDQYIKEENK